MNSTTNPTDKPVAVQPAQADTSGAIRLLHDQPVPKKRYVSMYEDIWAKAKYGDVWGFDNYSQAHSFYIMARRKWGSRAKWRTNVPETNKKFNVFYSKTK